MSNLIRNQYMHQFDWNDKLLDVQQYGMSFINKNAADKISKRVKFSHVIIHEFTNDKIPEKIKNLFNLEILEVHIVAMLENAFGGIHKDGVDRRAGFNIPLLNYKDGLMQWFEDTSTLNNNIIEYNNDYSRIRLTTTSMIPRKSDFESTVEYPSIVNVDKWHCIDNTTNINKRYVLRIRFKDNITFEELISTLIINR